MHIVAAARRAGIVTVESLRCALSDAGCRRSSHGHVCNLLAGRTVPTLDEVEAMLAHIGPAGIAEALAADDGGTVLWPGEHEGGDLASETVRLTREAAALADEAVEATSLTSPGGREITAAEWQAIHARGEAVHARLGHVLRAVRTRRVA